MGGFVVGDVIVFANPFSDLSATKRRPAVVVATPIGRDVIVAQITTNPSAPTAGVLITATDFESGQLSRDSYVRPTILFTLDPAIILYTAGTLTDSKTQDIRRAIALLFTT